MDRVGDRRRADAGGRDRRPDGRAPHLPEEQPAPGQDPQRLGGESLMDRESPELIEREMEETRESLTEKVALLEDKVVGQIHAATDTVHGTVESVQDTVQTVKAAVQDTVQCVAGTVKNSVR